VRICYTLLHEKSEYIVDIIAGMTGYRLSSDACHWTAVDMNGISVDARMFVSTHLWY